MQLIARISVRRHDAGEMRGAPGRAPAGRSVAVFRLLGRSPQNALRMLDAEVAKAGAPLVALALESAGMTAGQEKICETVVSQCRSRAIEVVVCGGDPARLAGRLAGGRSGKWYPSVATMVQQFGES